MGVVFGGTIILGFQCTCTRTRTRMAARACIPQAHWRHHCPRPSPLLDQGFLA